VLALIIVLWALTMKVEYSGSGLIRTPNTTKLCRKSSRGIEEETVLSSVIIKAIGLDFLCLL
jgi:hypothetical protein